MKKIVNLIVSGFVFLASFVPFLTVVNAEGGFKDSGLYKSAHFYENNTKVPSNTGDYTGDFKLLRTYSSYSNGIGTLVDIGQSGILFYSLSSSPTIVNWLIYTFNISGCTCTFAESANKIDWNVTKTYTITSTYTATLSDGSLGEKIYYISKQVQYNDLGNGDNSATNSYNIGKYFPDIPYIRNVSNLNDILAVISADEGSYFPWLYTDSSGGMHFDDGTEIDAQNRTLYDNVYLIMDINHDNSVTQEEVNYYNVTYNTNYDYQTINNGDDFTQIEFLKYVALMLLENKNPAGEGSGGGSAGGTAGGITVTDSFTQTQTQSIEENAVNVSIVNDGSVNNQNVQWINSIINNTLSGSDEENAFENAIGTVGNFIQLGQSFALLASAVLSFLPGWLLTLLSLMFSVLFVMVVFRLIHLFI